MAAARTLLLILTAHRAASITFPWAAPKTPARACVASANRGDLAAALGHLEAARINQDPDLNEAWAAVLDGLAASRSAATLMFFERMLHDGYGWADLPRATAQALDGLAPPPAVATGFEAVAPVMEPLPELWVDTSTKVKEARGDHAAALNTARRHRAPVLLKNVGMKWPEWTASDLARGFPAGAVCRVAPSAAVSFCRESHPDIKSGAVKALSQALIVSSLEVERRLSGDAAAPFVYEGGEHLYVQASASPALLRDVDLGFLGNFKARDACRVWACRGGVYSPLHYDSQDSHLIQVTGSKRVVLWPVDALVRCGVRNCLTARRGSTRLSRRRRCGPTPPRPRSTRGGYA